MVAIQCHCIREIPHGETRKDKPSAPTSTAASILPQPHVNSIRSIGICSPCRVLCAHHVQAVINWAVVISYHGTLGSGRDSTAVVAQ